MLILTHRRNLVDQFHGELRDRGYRDRISGPLLDGHDAANGPVTVETYQWFVRNAGRISDAYTIVICDEAHTALGEKTSAAIRNWAGPIFIGMTATGALIARHVTDLFPTQTSRFDLAQAARRGVISPLRCIRIPPGPGVRTIAKVPLRRGEVDTEFDQEMLAELLDQTPFNLAIADLYKTRFNGVPGVVYAAGVRHAYNVAQAFRDLGMKAQAVSGETPKRELARILADYESRQDRRAGQRPAARRGLELAARDDLHAPGAHGVQAHLPAARRPRDPPPSGQGGGHRRSTSCTRRPSTTTRWSRCTRCSTATSTAAARSSSARCAAGAAAACGSSAACCRSPPIPSGAPRCSSASCGASPSSIWTTASSTCGPRWPARAWPRTAGAAPRRCSTSTATASSSGASCSPRCSATATPSCACARSRRSPPAATPRPSTRRSTSSAGWPRDERREGVKIMLQALAERRIGRRDQANAWIWRMAEYTREVHEEYAVQRWPETKRLLGLLVNSRAARHTPATPAGWCTPRARRIAACRPPCWPPRWPHTPEAEEALRGARTRMARKPAALARELLRNFPKGRRGKSRRRRKSTGNVNGDQAAAVAVAGRGADPPDPGDDALDDEDTLRDEGLDEGDAFEERLEAEAEPDPRAHDSDTKSDTPAASADAAPVTRTPSRNRGRSRGRGRGRGNGGPDSGGRNAEEAA